MVGKLPFIKLSGLYHGFPPLLAGVVVACAVTGMFWSKLHHHQVYQDVIVGAITWADDDKERDFRAYYLLVGLTLAGAVGVAALFRSLSPEGAKGEVGRSLNTLLLWALLPAAWRLGMALAVSGSDWVPKDSLFLVLAVAAVAGGLWRFRRDLTGALVTQIGGASLLAVLFGFFGGLGVAVSAGRLFPALCISLGDKVSWFWAAGAGGAGLALAVIFVRARDVLALRRRVFQVVFVAQAPLPLLFAVMIPPPVREGAKAFATPHTLALPATLGLLALAATVLLVLRYRRWAGTGDPTAAGINGVLAPLCLSAIAVFVMVPTLEAPRLVPDFFHDGELLVPWQQIVGFGKTPYVDFVPIHGLKSLLSGLFHVVFFDGTAATYPDTLPVLAGLCALATYLGASALAGPLVALFSGLMLVDYGRDRLFFLAPCLFLLANRRLLARPQWWLVVWPLASVFLVFYNATLGPAFVLATVPVACWMAYRLARDNRRALGIVTAAMACAVAAVFLTPLTRAMLTGFLQSLLASAASNGVAYGIPWERSFSVRQPLSPQSLTPLGWEAIRLSWLIVAGVAAFRLWRELGLPREQRRPDVVCLSVTVCLTLLLDVGYLLGRIDPGMLSRTGSMSVFALGHLLPVLLLLSSKPGRWASIAAALTVTMGFLDMGATGRSFEDVLTAKPLAVRLVPPGVTLVNGADIGLPQLGRIGADPDTLGQVREFKDALATLLKPGETFLDLTNQTAYYFHLNLPVPVLYAANYTAASSIMQGQMLRQLDAHPVPVVLIGPSINFDGAPASLRTYHLYREFLLRYVALQRGRFTFLVDPARAPAAGPPGSPEQLALLEPIFLGSLHRVPVAWGNSWPTLASRFQEMAAIGPEHRGDLHQVVEEEEGRCVATGDHPFITYQVGDLGLAGTDADYIKLDFECERTPLTTDAVVAVRWLSAGRELSSPVRFCVPKSSTVLIPVGTSPSWLLGERLETLRFEFENPGSCRSFALKNIHLLRLNPAR